ARALGVPEEPGRLLSETLAAYLRTKQLLLVIDNCEHLVVACATLAHMLLQSCPGLQILATSREALGVPGEIIWPVQSLSLPHPQKLASLDSMEQSEAVRLFVERVLI